MPASIQPYNINIQTADDQVVRPQDNISRFMQTFSKIEEAINLLFEEERIPNTPENLEAISQYSSQLNQMMDLAKVMLKPNQFPNNPVLRSVCGLILHDFINAILIIRMAIDFIKSNLRKGIDNNLPYTETRNVFFDPNMFKEGLAFLSLIKSLFDETTNVSLLQIIQTIILPNPETNIQISEESEPPLLSNPVEIFILRTLILNATNVDRVRLIEVEFSTYASGENVFRIYDDSDLDWPESYISNLEDAYIEGFSKIGNFIGEAFERGGKISANILGYLARQHDYDLSKRLIKLSGLQNHEKGKRKYIEIVFPSRQASERLLVQQPINTPVEA